MKVSDAVVECLEAEGVEYVFGVPGEENEDLLFSLENSPIEFIPTRHESGAAFMANMWGRLTGHAGVCLATLGPGATNLVTGVADANLDKAPVVAITGQGDISRIHHESHQYIDIVDMFKPITKWNTTITHPDTTAEIMRKAFKVAEYEKPGATHVELPEDIAKEEVSEGIYVIPRRRVRRAAPDYKAIREVLELLRESKRPLIIAGNGSIRKLASKHLTQFVEKYNIPVASTFMGKGAVSDRKPQSLLSIGLGFKDYVVEAVEQADLVITVGYDVAEYSPSRWNPNNDKKIIHIDFTPAEVYSHYQPVVEVVCDVSGALWEMEKQLAETGLVIEQNWYVAIRERILADIASYDLVDGEKFTIPGALNVIRELLPDDGLMISDVGSHKMWISRNFPTYTANGCIIANGLASMGIALPGGLAASLVDPGRKIIAAMGDGGFLMNSQELETATRVGAKYTVIVFNDNDYGLINWKQTMARGSSVGTRLTNPDFVQYANSFGIKAYRPTSLEELRSMLQEAIEADEMNVVEIPVDPTVNMELIQKLKEHWKNGN